jgi:CheY-like chemotaxis protein
MNLHLVEILLVEDDAQDAELTIHKLKKFGLANDLLHVWNGGEALDFIYAKGKYFGIRKMEEKPKLILMDIKMPGSTGIEVLEIIKSDKRTSLISVIMLTSSNESPEIKKCFKLGADGYMVKPMDIRRLLHSINHLDISWLYQDQSRI